MAVVGATGNVGTKVVAALSAEPSVSEVIGIAKRRPDIGLDSVRWVTADIAVDPLDEVLAGVDAVIHLAWLIQPSHDEQGLWRTNVSGTERLLDAVARCGVPTVLYASSIGAYSPAPGRRPVDESWPTNGIPTSQYSRHKVAVERLLDQFERELPDRRVVRLRKALIFQAGAAQGIRRLFLGPLVPLGPLGRHGVPVIPRSEQFTIQGVHADDVGEAYRLALLGDLRGAVNIAADPPLTPDALSDVLGARQVPVGRAVLKAGAAVAHRMRLQPVEPGWIDLAAGVPVMDTTRARTELGWTPHWSATDAMRDLLRGFAEDLEVPTPPLTGATP
ncbi:MAG: NAD-dependent epimerase/dehydratase family protein [Acidimicrobiales bacterium]